MKIISSGFLAAFIFFISACNDHQSHSTATSVDSSQHQSVSVLPERSAFQDTIDGKAVDLFILKNSNGMKAAFTNYGGRLVGLWLPDKDGKMTDVVVGFGSLKDYLKSTEPYFGATIGRFGNRIA